MTIPISTVAADFKIARWFGLFMMKSGDASRFQFPLQLTCPCGVTVTYETASQVPQYADHPCGDETHTTIATHTHYNYGAHNGHV